jgi:NAD(P)-dependent dehydrogenase (short-subunit alcohol dehydrogenase family)
MQPAGRHAVVTGGGQGIGASIARGLTDAGADVTIMGRNAASLEAAVRDGVAKRFLVVDLTNSASLAHAFGSIETVDILVNNAGAAESAPFRRLDRDHWDRMIAINLTSVYEATRAVIAGMAGRGWGRIVNIASTAGLIGYPYVAAYVAAKHGVIGLTRALALEMAKSGVTVNAVCPGYTQTGLLDGAVRKVVDLTGRGEEDVRAGLARSNPQGRLVTVEEVAQTVLFLCGPASDAMNGQAIAVAGGEVM